VCVSPSDRCGADWRVEVSEQTARVSPAYGWTTTSQGSGEFLTSPDDVGNATIDGLQVDAPTTWSWTVKDVNSSDLCAGAGGADTVGGGLRLKREISSDGHVIPGQLEVIVAMGYILGLCAPTDSAESIFDLASTADLPIRIEDNDGATVTQVVTMQLDGLTVTTSYTITLHIPGGAQP
jgi:hypothetical protein